MTDMTNAKHIPQPSMSEPDPPPPQSTDLLARPVATLGDLAALVPTWTDLNKMQRAVLTTRIHTIGLVATNARLRAGKALSRVRRGDVSLASIPCDVAWLNSNIFADAPATHGLSTRARRDAVSRLRYALRRVGLIDPARQVLPPASSAWGVLFDALTAEKHCLLGLGRFATWCYASGIRPADVVDQTLHDFEAYVTTRTLHDDIPGLIRVVAKAWRKAASIAAKWPQNGLAAPRRREPYVLALGAFPVSFQEDVERLATRLSGRDRRGPFRGDGPRRPARASTVKSRVFSVRQAATSLVLMGRAPETITSLADLVEEASYEAILHWFWRHAIELRVARGEYESVDTAPVEAGITSQTGAIAQTLLTIAKYCCKLPADVIARLSALAADVRPKRQTHLTQKNLDRLRQFDDPATLAALLAMPEKLMRRAELMTRSGPPPYKAALLARVAAAVELLLHAPVRIGNLVALQLGVHLKFNAGTNGRITHLALPESITKNEINGEWAIDGETAQFLDRYIQQFRPRLAVAGTLWMFPSGRGRADCSLSIDGMGQHIIRTTADEAGAVVNPHLFRSLVARLVLTDSPGALEDVRLLLGDKSMVTVLAHYASIEGSHAARRHDDVLRRARQHKTRPAKATAKPALPARR